MTPRDDARPRKKQTRQDPGILSKSNHNRTLRDEVSRSLSRYFEELDDQPVTDLYEMVMSEVEAPLFDAVMRYADSNQSKASTMLGLNRGTLRKKLKQYGLL